MPANETDRPDYESLDSPGNGGKAARGDHESLTSSGKKASKTDSENGQSLKNYRHEENKEKPPQLSDSIDESLGAEVSSSSSQRSDRTESPKVAETPRDPAPEAEVSPELTPTEKAKLKRLEKRAAKDKELLSSDNWLVRNGHNLTYLGLFIFSFLVLLRPYEMTPRLGFLAATAYYVALATLAFYIPTQISTEGTFTHLSTEVKCVIAMTAIALIGIRLAKHPPTAWETFNDIFVKAALMFVVMVNVIRTRKRLMGLVWLSLFIALYLSYTAWTKYMLGEFTVEGYRIEGGIGGMYANPNDMALHLVMMMPIALTLGIASKSTAMRVVYLLMWALFIAGIMVTFSRGGFLGLMAASGVLAWKLGRQYRLNVTLTSLVVGGLALLLAPGNYGIRLLSIFLPGLDPVGSSGQRREILWQSLIVTLRNPWGIGMGNYNIVGLRHLGTHNAYTQVSTELGVLGLIAYLIFIVSPFRKLGAIERTQVSNKKMDWYYYLSIGLQASIVGYMVSSFFAAVAYNWYIYYLIAYAIAFRRIYQIENNVNGDEERPFLSDAISRWKIRPV